MTYAAWRSDVWGDVMLARLVGIILGLILTTSGYVVAGWGSLGNWAAHLDLGPFEPHRPIAGAAATILGALLIVAALRPQPGARKAKAAPPLAFDPPAQPLAAPAFQPFAESPTLAPPTPPPAAEVEPPPWSPQYLTPAPQATAPAPVAAPANPAPLPEPTFVELRARMIALCDAEAWSQAALALSAMKRAADTDETLAIVHRDLGDFARGQGKVEEAAEAYENAVGHARLVRQARQDDASAELLAGALSGVGDAAEAEGRLHAALTAFEEALVLRRSRADRGDVEAQRALSVNLERLADLRDDLGHRMRALELYRESHVIGERLTAVDPGRFGPDLTATRERLMALEAWLAL